ncbi:hypothetical protein BCU68_12250 [Vibrio sp. 10N.286.49.B3]|uniref:GGDEF domain-containing protein n=1 Tax=Vibrio sp. 10N.286.49.B3 TaxID=1880855 RepID=UPI000C851D02|nr:GGDEF domain-containing protein [Vibrio sp. 10N.286.49.B3]PMH44618.1 hypothetical protein BCU68_12250 [Vibrio sp. 10N.286.49.B3]
MNIIYKSGTILLITSLLVILFQISTEKTFNLLDYPTTLFGDEENNGGNTRVSILKGADDITYECQLGDQYAWPFCEYEFTLSDDGKNGVDLRLYDVAELNMSFYVGGELLQGEPVRIYIKQYDSSLPPSAGFKANLIEIDANTSNDAVKMPLKYMRTADWWRYEHSIPFEKAHTERSNIVSISISTPDKAKVGTYKVIIHSFVLKGKYIHNQTLYLFLSIAWATFGISVLMAAFINYRKELSQLQVNNTNLQKLNQKYKSLSTYDALTGALNRNGSAELTQLIGKGLGGMGVIYIDLDHFKQLNDNYGHHIGDQVLQSFARLCHNYQYQNKHLIRWGGEEFMLFIENASEDESYQHASELLAAMREVDWPYDIHLTCSIGVTNCKDIKYFDLAIQQADKAMYHSKKNGRNQVTKWSSIIEKV